MNSSNGSEYEYCGKGWADFWGHYTLIDPYVTVVICSVGFVTNILNMLVFTRRGMWTPTNSILASLAFADFLCCVRVLVTRAIFMWVDQNGDYRSSYRSAVEDLMEWVTLNLFHIWSVYLTLTMAVWRFMAVVYPLRSRSWCTWRSTRMSIASVFAWGGMIVPLMFAGISLMTTEGGNGGLKYKFEFEDDAPGWTAFLWIHGLLIKVLPSIAMTVLSIEMVRSLVRVETSRRQTTVGSNPSQNNPPIQSSWEEQEQKHRQEFNLVTRMLLVILVIFLITEFPYGILSLVDILMESEKYYRECDQPLEDLLNAMEFVSSSTSFFVYVIMSRKFQATLLGLGRNVLHCCVKNSRKDSTSTLKSDVVTNHNGSMMVNYEMDSVKT